MRGSVLKSSGFSELRLQDSEHSEQDSQRLRHYRQRATQARPAFTKVSAVKASEGLDFFS